MKRIDYYKVRKQKSEDFRFSILIPSWNNLDYLKLCIRSIQENSHFKNQIIVLINEGVDGTLDWIKNQPDIDYIHIKENTGICFALNLGRSLVQTDYIIYINDDMYVCPDWDLHFDMEISKIGHNYFYLSGTVIEPYKSSYNSVIFGNYGTDLTSFNEKKLLEEYKSLSSYDWCGSTWPPSLVHIDLWDIVGGLSIEFSPGFYSDPDFSRKMWEIGVRYFKGIGESKVYHFVSISRKKFHGLSTGRYKFILKWGISSNYFMNLFLKKCSVFKGELTEPQLKKSDLILNKFKTMITALRMRKSF
jgi:glycosyltransferase involved in cell wall biosynthesis